MTEPVNIFCVSYSGSCCIEFDTEMNFDLIVLNYSVDPDKQKYPFPCTHTINKRTECKGDYMLEVLNYIHNNYKTYNRVCVFDDDIDISVTQINKLFQSADKYNLDLFSPSLTKNSHYTYPHVLNKKPTGYRNHWMIEVMMPGFSNKFIESFFPVFSEIYNRHDLKSSWGLDLNLFPFVLGDIMEKPVKSGIVDDVIVTHNKPITSGHRRYSNGLTGPEEIQIIWDFVHKELVRRYHPERFKHEQTQQ